MEVPRRGCRRGSATVAKEPPGLVTLYWTERAAKLELWKGVLVAFTTKGTASPLHRRGQALELPEPAAVHRRLLLVVLGLLETVVPQPYGAFCASNAVTGSLCQSGRGRALDVLHAEGGKLRGACRGRARRGSDDSIDLFPLTARENWEAV